MKLLLAGLVLLTIGIMLAVYFTFYVPELVYFWIFPFVNPLFVIRDFFRMLGAALAMLGAVLTAIWVLKHR